MEALQCSRGIPPLRDHHSNQRCAATNALCPMDRSARAGGPPAAPATAEPAAAQTSSCRQDTATRRHPPHSRAMAPCGCTPGRRRAPTPSTPSDARLSSAPGGERPSGCCGASSPLLILGTSSSLPTTWCQTKRLSKIILTGKDATIKLGLQNIPYYHFYPRIYLNNSTELQMCTLYS